MKYLWILLVLVTLHHTVAQGDTLQSIAERYCLGSDSQQVAEFREGIRQINYSLIGEGEPEPGIVLEINRWE